MANGDLFDKRLYRVLDFGGSKYAVKPGITSDSYFYDYYETPQAAAQAAQERETDNPDENAELQRIATDRKGKIEGLEQKFWSDHQATMSFVHPYALLKLVGSIGNSSNIDGQYLIDKAGRRRFYEIDGDLEGGYANAPTTAALIQWGRQDPKGRTPYSFADFVYCKYWNRIANNRLITLRRYAMPVPDSLEPADYKGGGSLDAGDGRSVPQPSDDAFAPVCTAVTYFGEGTDNSLKDILRFSVGYEWKEIEADVWKTTSNQIDAGNGAMGVAGGFWGTGLSQIIMGLGILDDLKGTNKIVPTNAVGIGPDPYANGPYENRIIGPINVINKIYKRERGLKFTQDGLEITFEYVSRPIAGVNNKAIMLDLLSNMMMMTSGSGTFFGGAHRYRCEKPAVYPYRDTYSLTQLYRGKIFGKNGAPRALMQHAFNSENTGFMKNFASELLNDIKGIAQSLLDKMLGRDSSESSSGGGDAVEKLKDTAGRVVSAHLLKGATIPWLENARAILTGEPIGDWHLTIGNPLNPIAMIGNLIVDDCTFEFSDELGPDDFPISFKAKVKLMHGMGRDRDAAQSMFNRGYGRIYSLPDNFITSADKGTAVDKQTENMGQFGELKHWTGLATSGSDSITKMGHYPLSNKGSVYNNELKRYEVTLTDSKETASAMYKATPWHTRWTM